MLLEGENNAFSHREHARGISSWHLLRNGMMQAALNKTPGATASAPVLFQTSLLSVSVFHSLAVTKANVNELLCIRSQPQPAYFGGDDKEIGTKTDE